MDRFSPVESEGIPYPDEVAALPNLGDVDDSDEEFDLDPELKSEGCDVCHPKTEEKIDDDSTEPKTGWTDQVRMIHLRRYVDQLAETIKEKDYVVSKTREELKKCKDTITTIEQDREQTAVELKQEADANNISAFNRLQAKLDKLNQEMDNEEELFEKIKAKLDNAEYELAKAQVEQGKHLLEEDELIKKEEKLIEEKQEQAKFRNRKEIKYARNAIQQDGNYRRRQNEQLAAKHKSMQDAIEDAKRSHQKHNPHLNHTLQKLKQREQEEEIRQKEHMKKRMESMFALKQDISANRENFHAILTRKAVLEEQRKNNEMLLIQKIADEGGNAEMEILKRRRLHKIEREKRKLLKIQRNNEVEIAEKLLAEDAEMERKKKLYPYMFTTKKSELEKRVGPVKPEAEPKLFQLIRDSENNGSPRNIDLEKFNCTGDESDDEEELRRLAGTEAQFKEVLKNIPLSDESSDPEQEGDETVLELEFEGEWEHEDPPPAAQGQELKQEMSEKTFKEPPGKTKMDKDIFHRQMMVLRQNMIKTKKVGVIDLKGKSPFSAKPNVIKFTDFVVGETYQQLVAFTNVSFTTNYLKILGMTENLKDFIEVDFKPPGQLSSGLTCEMMITFKPMVNQDMEGRMNLVAQTGTFFLPIICTTKKVKISVDTKSIDFGVSVIGETLRRSFTLSNSGALPTNFRFMKVSDLKPQTSQTYTSLGQLTPQDSVQSLVDDGEEQNDDERVEEQEEFDVDGEEKKDPEKPEQDGEAVRAESDAGDGDEGASIELDRLDDLADLEGLRIVGPTAGEVSAFSSVTIELIWQPTIPGKAEQEFVITFEHPNIDNIIITAAGLATDVPVHIPRQMVDLKICMVDRLYQDTAVVYSRVNIAHRLTFEVPPELRNHLEVLPHTGYIQGLSKFSAQIKFIPKRSIFTESCKYFDKETGVLEAPVTIWIADQTKPIYFSVHGVVTLTDLEFNMKEIDFGHCTIYESVVRKVAITNRSILPQRFGFTKIPEFVDVQPDDGFGTLLPLETIEVDVVFSPPRARSYQFELYCKTLIGREFKLKCKAIGVHPPLKLSEQLVHFKSTALNDLAIHVVDLKNLHTNMNEFQQAVPRVGEGPIAPVGPTSFEFIVPDGAPFTVCPSVGTINPGESEPIQIRYIPRIPDPLIRREAVRLITRRLEREAEEEYKRQLQLAEQQRKEEALKAADKSKKPKDLRKGAQSPKVDKPVTVTLQIKGPLPVVPPEPESLSRDSNDYNLGHTSLIQQFNGDFQKYVITCYTASGTAAKAGELPYSVHNTLFLEVCCPSRPPDIMVMSDYGRHVIDYGNISVGQKVIKSVSLQNMTGKMLRFKPTIFDTSGPFEVRNAMRDVEPFDIFSVVVAFQPDKAGVFQENLKVDCGFSDLYLVAKGRGVTPFINLSIPDGLYDMGTVIAGEYKEEVLRIDNSSILSIQFNIRLDSNAIDRYKKKQHLPTSIKEPLEPEKVSIVGVQNWSGKGVFDCVPRNGIIPAGGSVELTVTFAPDHHSDLYSDKMHIDLFGKSDQHILHLVGRCRTSIMYVRGGDEIIPYAESLVVPAKKRKRGEPGIVETNKPMIVSLYSISKDLEYFTCSREIFIGCVRTMAVSQKKPEPKKPSPKQKTAPGVPAITTQNGEWQFDDLKPLQAQGFNIDFPKGMLEAGTEKTITITWKPTFDSNSTITVIDIPINVTLRGDITEVQKIIIRGFVVTPLGSLKLEDELERQKKRDPRHKPRQVQVAEKPQEQATTTHIPEVIEPPETVVEKEPEVKETVVVALAEEAEVAKTEAVPVEKISSPGEESTKTT